jgi:hypothetical protein
MADAAGSAGMIEGLRPGDLCEESTVQTHRGPRVVRRQPLYDVLEDGRHGLQYSGYDVVTDVAGYDLLNIADLSDMLRVKIVSGGSTPHYVHLGGAERISTTPPLMRRQRRSLSPCSVSEDKARRLLLRFVGWRRFARYMRDGFISIRGRSGKVYQIFPGSDHTSVWEPTREGYRNIEDLCVCIQDPHIPPTDSVVVRMLMIEYNEDEFRAQCNAWKGRHARSA